MRYAFDITMKKNIFLIVLVVFSASVEARHKKSKLDSLTGPIAERLDAALVSPPKDEDTCFSPDEPCDVKLLKFIDSAQTSLDIAIYDINLDQLVHHILVQKTKIPVRIVVDRRQAKGGAFTRAYTAQGGRKS